MWRNAITFAYIWGVRDKSRGLNSNMFLCRGNCFARLRKNSLPVSVVESIEIPKQISYVLRGIKRAISRRLVKISDCRVSSFLKTVPGRRVSRHLIFRIWKLKFKRNALIYHWLIPLFVYCRNNCTLCWKSSKEYSENCMFWGYKAMADLWRPMLNKIGEEIKHKFPICMHAMSATG